MNLWPEIQTANRSNFFFLLHSELLASGPSIKKWFHTSDAESHPIKKINHLYWFIFSIISSDFIPKIEIMGCYSMCLRGMTSQTITLKNTYILYRAPFIPFIGTCSINPLWWEEFLLKMVASANRKERRRVNKAFKAKKNLSSFVFYLCPGANVSLTATLVMTGYQCREVFTKERDYSKKCCL